MLTSAWRLSVSLLLGGLLAAATAWAAPPQPQVGDSVELPDITLIDGRHRSAGHYQGKPMVVQYWAVWCPYCARQNPHLQQLWEQAEARGLEVLTISLDQDVAEVRHHMAERNYTFPVTMQDQNLLDVFGKPGVVPKLYVIDARGRIAEIIPGEMFPADVLGLLKYAP